MDLDYGEFRMQLHLDEARHHAARLLEASEAAQTDGFWFKFGMQALDMEMEEVSGILQAYSVYRQNYLEGNLDFEF